MELKTITLHLILFFQGQGLGRCELSELMGRHPAMVSLPRRSSQILLLKLKMIMVETGQVNVKSRLDTFQLTSTCSFR